MRKHCQSSSWQRDREGCWRGLAWREFMASCTLRMKAAGLRRGMTDLPSMRGDSGRMAHPSGAAIEASFGGRKGENKSLEAVWTYTVRLTRYDCSGTSFFQAVFRVRCAAGSAHSLSSHARKVARSGVGRGPVREIYVECSFAKGLGRDAPGTPYRVRLYAVIT